MTGKLFFDDEFDALQQMIAASHRTPKEVAMYLWPDMKPESAYSKLKACINANGDERLRFSQVIAAMNFCEQYQPLEYANQETSHAPAVKIAPADQEAILAQQLAGYAELMTKALTHVERLRKAARR